MINIKSQLIYNSIKFFNAVLPQADSIVIGKKSKQKVAIAIECLSNFLDPAYKVNSINFQMLNFCP